MSELKDARMEVPPIPPGCPYLWSSDARGLSFTPPGCCVYEDDGAAFRIWRPIIAAVARCAWLDEAYKTKQWYDREKCSALKVEPFKALGDALQNAHAWAEWGKQ